MSKTLMLIDDLINEFNKLVDIVCVKKNDTLFDNQATDLQTTDYRSNNLPVIHQPTEPEPLKLQQELKLEFSDQFTDPGLYYALTGLIKNNCKVFALIQGIDSKNNFQEFEEALLTEMRQYIDSLFTLHCIKDVDDLNEPKNQNPDNDAIIILTKDQTKKYMKLMENMKKNGYVALIMEIKSGSLVQNASPKQQEKKNGKQEKQFQVPGPMYYGIFVSKKEYENTFGNSLPYTQTTPLHCTCMFVGGNKKMKVPDEVIGSVGKNFVIEITGLSNSQSGQGLVVCNKSMDQKGFHGNPLTPHITLSTNQGFKPVDVGKQITVENTSPVNGANDSPRMVHVLKGIYSPTW